MINKNGADSDEAKDDEVSCPIRKRGQKEINLAIQGGGAHGAFTWGVIDRILEDNRLSIEGISGTSAGSMNASVLAYGLLKGGNEKARELLHDFWFDLSQTGALCNPCKQMPWETFLYGEDNMDQSMGYQFFQTMTRWFSPYQLNPFDLNPLKDVLLRHVNFDKLQQCQVTKLFISATNVRTGQARVFHTDEITSDVVLASACLPYIFKAIEINGEYYWDGGYTGNPALFPFFYYVDNPDIMIIHVNPIERPSPPTQPSDIFNRINEISFNAALLREFRSIAFVHKLIDEDWLKDEYKNKLKYIFVHSISADTALNDLSTATKLSSDWNFLLKLRNRGRAKASEWLARNYEHIGKKSTLDLRYELASPSQKNRPQNEQNNVRNVLERIFYLQLKGIFMYKLLSSIFLSISASSTVFAGVMGEIAPINFYTFVAVEGGYTWNDIDGISAVGTGSAFEGSLDSFGSTSKSNSGGSVRLSAGLMRLIRKSLYFSGEVAWGYYGNTVLTFNDTVINTANSNNINGSTLKNTITGFDVLLGAVYNREKYDVFVKAGGLMQNSNLKGQLLSNGSSNNGGGITNILAQTTLPQILPELKVGGTYHVTDNIGVVASYSHAFGYASKVNILSTNCQNNGTGPNCTGGYYSDSVIDVNINPSLDIVLLGLEYRFA